MTASPPSRRLLPALAAALLAACGGKSGPPPGPPTIAGFSASPGLVVAGSPAELTATFEGGAGSVDQGVGEVASGTPVAVAPAADTTYTLTVASAGGQATRSATVLVNAPPAITVQPAPQWLLVGETGSLTVVATASGALSYQWQKDGADLAGATGPMLSVPSARPADAGSYAVRVTSSRGGTSASALSAAARVLVDPLTCQWLPVRREALDSPPSGVAPVTGPNGSQGALAAYGRTAWLQTAAWSQLFVPLSLQTSDDVVAARADVYVPPSSGLAATPDAHQAELLLFAAPGTGGSTTGGVKASLAVSGSPAQAVLRLQTWAGGAWTTVAAQAVTDPSGAWHTLTLRGRRASCSFTAAIDGAPAIDFSGSCDTSATRVALGSTSSNAPVGAPGVAWSNLSVSAGSGSWCIAPSRVNDCSALGTATCAGAQVTTCALDGGGWRTLATPVSCPGSLTCIPADAGCGIAPDATSFTGAISYEALVPNGTRSDWSSTAVIRPARGLLVQSRTPDPANPGAFLVRGTAVVDDAASPGTFTVPIRAAPDRTASDQLVFVALGPGNAYAVADPRTTGTLAIGTVPAAARIWSWSANLSDIHGGLTIRTGQGSAAAGAFDSVRAAWKSMASVQGRNGLSLLTWVGIGTGWNCGACFARASVSAFGLGFASQLWLAGDSNQSYWSSAVTSHELGHWAMSSYGTSPGEGGTHYLSVPTFPGQAWSEGWATFFSSDQRQDPVMLDKQQGSMFWFSLETRRYPGPTWQRPTPAAGLLQKMDENEVAALLWQLSAQGTSSGPLHAALASAHLNTSPYRRGYTRHTWTTTSPGVFTDVVDTRQSVPAFPDALDALMCAGFSAAAMDAVMQPSVFYPYPSATPLCP